MATTNYPVNHPLARKAWGRTLWHEALSQTYAYKFIGNDSNSLIQLSEDLAKDKGDRIRLGLRMLLTGAGTRGDGTLEGNEESLTTYFDDTLIDQLRHAVRVGGRMSEQRVPFSVREEARLGLQDWWAERIDQWMFNQLAGNSAQTDINYTGMQAAVEPDANHLIAAGGHGTEASLSATTTESVNLADIDRCVALAKTMNDVTSGAGVRIRPITIEGNQWYVMFLHSYQVYQLRRDASTTGNWFDVQKAAIQGGQIADNPIFNGAVGIYNGVILHESDRVPVITGTPNSGSASQFRRAIFAGAQAACMAVGRGYDVNEPARMDWVEEYFDYENQLGVAAGMIGGLKKSRYNSLDFSTIAVSGYAPQP